LSSEDEVVDATIVESAKTDDRKSVMFGWCMTEYHDGCIGEFVGHVCRCECHSDLGKNVVEENE
jgi:hypothetical protein